MFGLFKKPPAPTEGELRFKATLEKQRLISNKKALGEKISTHVKKNLATLTRQRRLLLAPDRYGSVNEARWNKEIQKFFDSVVKKNLTLVDIDNLKELGPSEIALEFIERPVLAEMLRQDSLARQHGDVNALSPTEYEHFCAKILKSIGWSCEVTKASGDQGADVIAQKGQLILIIQCKKYVGSVGNDAVQQVLAAKIHYRGTHAAVVSTGKFTKSAQELAHSTNVLLLSHQELSNLNIH